MPILRWIVLLFSLAVTLPAASQPLLPVPQPAYGELKAVLDREAERLTPRDNPRYAVTLAVTLAMLGDLAGATRLNERLTPADRHIGNGHLVDQALEFQGALAQSRTFQFNRARQAFETRQAILRERIQAGPVPARALKQLQDDVAAAEAGFADEETLVASHVLFTSGKLAAAIQRLDDLKDRDAEARKRESLATYARHLVLRNEGTQAIAALSGAPGASGLSPWLLAQLLAFHGDTALANQVADGIDNEESWRGAKLGVALALARFNRTREAVAMVREVIGNRGRPLAPGALAKAQLITTRKNYASPRDMTSNDRRWPLDLFHDALPMRQTQRLAAVSVVAINLHDQGETAGAREALRAYVRSMEAAAPAGSEAVAIFSSLARRLARFGDQEGGMQAWATMERFVPVGHEADRFGLRQGRFGNGEFVVEASVRLHGLDATWKLIEAAELNDGLRLYFYCVAAKWAIHAGVSMEDLLRRMSEVQSRECGATIVGALAAAGRFNELAREVPRTDQAFTVRNVEHLARILAEAPLASEAIPGVLTQLLERCAQTGCPSGSADVSASMPILLVALARHDAADTWIDRAIAHMIGHGAPWDQLVRPGGLADEAWRLPPGAMDRLVESLGGRIPRSVGLHARSASHAHAGDVTRALQLATQIDADDQRIDALARITAAAWRAAHAGVLEVEFAFSAKRRATMPH